MINADATKNIGLRGITIADTQVSMVDGKEGNLLYRGYTIQDLAKQATFEEIVYLLLMGDAPTGEQLQEVGETLAKMRDLPDEIEQMLRCRPKTANPMDVMQSAVAALADMDPGLDSSDRDTVYLSCLRLIARFATTAAA